MTEQELSKLGSTLWGIADDLRGAMNADDFRDYMLSFLFLRYLSDNYEAAAQKELGADYPKPVDDDKRAPLSIWYAANAGDVAEFEKQMRRKVHYVIEPQHLWSSIAELARTQNGELLHTLEKGFKYIENHSSIPKSSAKITLTGMPNCAKLSAKLPKGLPDSRLIAIFWAMPTNT
jgi:type I restriction enzyme M protein